jgi:hypothetical protein
MTKKKNTGIDNTGESNSGDWNSGDSNSGDGNSGNRNSGDWNSGDSNSGDSNSGDRNSGYGNSGYGNSGNSNSGDSNSGNRNSGYGNSTDRESGIFNSEAGKVRVFNKETNLTWDEIDHPHFNEFYLNKWISESEMTDEEKKNDSEFYVQGGYLKKFTWNEAWSNFWRDTDEKNRQKFLNLPNFDAQIFFDITGIDVKKSSLVGKEVEVKIDGKVYKATIQEG